MTVPSSVASSTSRTPWLDGWALAVLAWTALFGVVFRTWRVVDGLWGTGRLDELAWIPRTVGVDLAFAVAVWLLVGVPSAALGRGRLGLAGRGLGVLGLIGVLLLGCANVLSFHVSGSALTWQRLRGDEGATVRDIALIDWTDAWPVLLFASLAATSLALVLAQAPRLETVPALVRRRFLASFVVVAVGAWGTYALVWDNRDRGIGRHYAGILVESLAQSLRRRPAALEAFRAPAPTDAGWKALFRPDRPTTPTPTTPVRAVPATKNVIVFFSEGVPLEHTSLHPAGPPTTPRLKARAERSGLTMTRFYSPYHRSIHALFSLLCGEFPPPEALGITLLNPRIDCGEWSTAFARGGLKPGFLHGGFFSFYDKGQFLNDRDYVVLKDATEVGEAEHWERNGWGIDDRAMVESALAFIDSLAPDDRFALVLVPITAHYPFIVPADVPTPFGTHRKIDRFWNSVAFLDLVFDQLMTGLEQRGLLDDTLVLFTADHGESPQEPPRVTNVDRAAYEYDVRVPAVLFSSSMFPTPATSDRLVGIPDILPTMLDAAGVPDERTRQGSSFLSPSWEEKRFFLGTARSDIHQLGFLDGTFKFLLNTGNGTTELYDLQNDPDELNDLAAKDPARVARYQDIALTWGDWQAKRLATWPKLDTPPDVHELLANDFEVTAIDAAGTRIPCAPPEGGGSSRLCPGLAPGLYPGVVDVTVGGAPRRCLSVVAPEGGRIELRAVDRDYFRRISMMQLSRTNDRRPSPAIRDAVNVRIDDRVFPMDQRRKFPRIPLPPPRHELVVDVATSSRVCLYFSVRAWAPTSGAAAPTPPGIDP